MQYRTYIRYLMSAANPIRLLTAEGVPRLPMLVVLLLVLVGCDKARQLTVQVDDVEVIVDLASTPDSRGQGLMGRERLQQNQGMLLVFSEPQIIKIWMLNMKMPLDVGFFDGEGVLLNWKSMIPDGGVAVHRSDGEALYALEMNSGWFERHAISMGARLHLPGVIQAE